MTFDGTYRSLNPKAYADGYAYGNSSNPQGRFAEGYTGAEIRKESEETDRSVAYSAYSEGHGDGFRDRWLRERNEGESLLDWSRRTGAGRNG